MNLQDTNPIEDMGALYRHPLNFFRALPQADSVDFWVLIKALGGAWVAYCLLQWSSMPESLASTLEGLRGLMAALFELGGNELGWAGRMKAREMAQSFSEIAPLLVGGIVAKALLFPIFQLLGIFVLAFGVMMMLPLLGVPMTRVSYFHLLAILGYCQWFSFLYFVPAIGGVLATIAVILLPILSIRSVFQISFIKAYTAFLFFPLCLLIGLTGFIFFSLGFNN